MAMRLRKRKFSCVVCNISVHAFEEAVTCDFCNNWTHVKCTEGEITRTEYLKAVNEKGDLQLMCAICKPLSNNRPLYESTRLEEIS